MERKTPPQGYRPSKLESNDESDSDTNIASSVARAEDFTSDNTPKSAGMNPDSIKDDIQSLKSDLLSLKESLASLTSTAATNTMGLASDAASKVTGTVSDAASLIVEKSSNMASVASKGAQSLSVEVEDLTRRNPLAALAGAVVIGLLIGMASRGRS